MMSLILVFLFAFPVFAEEKTINVMEAPYLAKGDGVTNDTAAIASALAAGLEIYFPTGYVFLTDGHEISTPKKIICGQQTTIKQRPNNLAPGSQEQVFAFNPGSEGSVLEGCLIDGNRDAAKPTYTTNEWACLTINAPYLTIRDVEVQECTTTGLNGRSLDPKHNLSIDHLSIHDSGLGITLKHASFAQINNLIVDHIHNETLPLSQHGIDILHSEEVQLNDIRLTNMGGDVEGQSAWASGLTIIDSSGQITNLYVADMVSATLKHIGVSVLSSAITGTNWKILRYAGTPLELQSNRHFFLTNFLIDCAYKTNSAQTASWGITLGGGGQYYDVNQQTRSISNFYGRETHLSNGVIKRCNYGIRQSTGNLFVDNVELTGMIHDGVFASDNYLATTGFSYSPRDTEHTGTIFSHVVARYNGGAGLHFENANLTRIVGGMYANNGQDVTKANGERGGIIDSGKGAIGPIFVADALVGDTQTGMTIANASIDWSTHDGSFTAGDTMQFLLTKSVDYFEGQRIGLLGVCRGVSCSMLDDSKNDIIVRIVDIDLDVVTAAIITPSGSYEETLTAGIGTLTTAGSAIIGASTSLDTQMLGSSWIKANGQYRRVVRAVSATTAKLASAFTPHLADTPFQVSQIATQLIPSQQYGIRLQNTPEAQLIGNRVVGNVVANHLVTSMKQFVTADATSPLLAERIGPNAVKFAVQVGGNNLGLYQKGNGQNAGWTSGAQSGEGYVISNGPNFGINDALRLAEGTRDATFMGAIRSTRPNGIGFSPKNALNQACNVTCAPGACVTAMDTANPGVFQECNSPLSDSCSCTN